MMILIDGYNFLHVTGLAGREIARGEIGRRSLERARNALLNFLAAALDDDARQLTTVVFDSNDAPPGLPRELQHHGITVKYAVGYENADELLEELIREESVPKQLTVVSSDHRVQRAANRRKARAIDSDVWYDEMRTSRRKSAEQIAIATPKPACPLSKEEVAAWLAEFADAPLEDAASSSSSSVENPFPPGYGEDLLDQE